MQPQILFQRPYRCLIEPTCLPMPTSKPLGPLTAKLSNDYSLYTLRLARLPHGHLIQWRERSLGVWGESTKHPKYAYSRVANSYPQSKMLDNQSVQMREPAGTASTTARWCLLYETNIRSCGETLGEHRDYVDSQDR